MLNNQAVDNFDELCLKVFPLSVELRVYQKQPFHPTKVGPTLPNPICGIILCMLFLLQFLYRSFLVSTKQQKHRKNQEMEKNLTVRCHLYGISWELEQDLAYSGIETSICESANLQNLVLSSYVTLDPLTGACTILQKECIFGGFDRGATTFWESPRNIAIKCSFGLLLLLGKGSLFSSQLGLFFVDRI